MKAKYAEKIHRDLARDLHLMRQEDEARSTIIRKLGGACNACGCNNASVLQVRAPKGLKACNFKDRLRALTGAADAPGFSLICGNCHVTESTAARRQKIADLSALLLDQWNREQADKAETPMAPTKEERQQQAVELQKRQMEAAKRILAEAEAEREALNTQRQEQEDKYIAEEKQRWLDRENERYNNEGGHIGPEKTCQATTVNPE